VLQNVHLLEQRLVHSGVVKALLQLRMLPDVFCDEVAFDELYHDCELLEVVAFVDHVSKDVDGFKLDVELLVRYVLFIFISFILVLVVFIDEN
jgi:hypothetical protein